MPEVNVITTLHQHNPVSLITLLSNYSSSSTRSDCYNKKGFTFWTCFFAIWIARFLQFANILTPFVSPLVPVWIPEKH